MPAPEKFLRSLCWYEPPKPKPMSNPGVALYGFCCAITSFIPKNNIAVRMSNCKFLFIFRSLKMLN